MDYNSVINTLRKKMIILFISVISKLIDVQKVLFYFILETYL